MKRRTFISLMSVMAAAGVLTLSGCSNSSGSTAASGTAASVAPAAGDQLSNIQSSGKLIVALEGAWQPWSYHDESTFSLLLQKNEHQLLLYCLSQEYHFVMFVNMDHVYTT